MGSRFSGQAGARGRWSLRAIAGSGLAAFALGAAGAAANLTENFDAGTAVPAGWVNGGTLNDTVNTHYQSAPYCRAFGIGKTLQTPPVDYPTNLAFYADASNAGNGKTATVDYSLDGGTNWTLLGSFVVGTAGGTKTIPLAAAPNLSQLASVRFRFNSTFATWYLDDVVVQTGSAAASNGPPLLNLNPPETRRIFALGDEIRIGVEAWEADGDEIALTAGDLPEGAVFTPNPLIGHSPLANEFVWNPSAPGISTVRFAAEDKDGTNQIDLVLLVLAAEPPPLLSEDFDASTELPEGWSGVGGTNWTSATHYRSAPNCRALWNGVSVTTPAVDYPTNLSFYADASNAGHGKNAGVSYRVGTNDWLPLGTFPVSTNGAAVSFSLLGAPDLSTNAGVQFQFTSTFTTWYLDDVVVRGGKFTDLPPLLAPIGPRAVALSNALTIAVTAMDVDRDEIVLAASNLPPGATFVAATNAGGITNVFTYAPEESEIGQVYVTTFYAADKDGITAETVTISVFDRLVRFASAGATAWEGDGGLPVAVVLSRPGDVTVEVAGGGTAVPGPAGDYVIAETNLAFTADGSATQYVELVLSDDALRETPETALLFLTNAVGADVFPGDRYALAIRDNDAALFEPLDADPGWSVQGSWAFGRPLGGGVNYPDPTAGYTGTNVYGYNLAGDYANNVSTTLYLTTPAVDCTHFRNVRLQFARWLGIESSNYDQAVVQVSRDRTNWIDAWRHAGYTIADLAWTNVDLDLAAIADGAPAIYVRWGLGPTDSDVVFGGWNVDDVVLAGDFASNAMFRFAATDFAARETSAVAQVTIERIGLTNVASEILFVTSEAGTAEAGTDYEAVETLLEFAPGERSRTAIVPLLDDPDVDPDETIGLQLRPTATGDVASPATARIVLQDDESPGAGLPFFDGFESGAFSNGWAPVSAGAGRIRIAPGTVPAFEGTGLAALDAVRYNSYGLNELTLTVDLAGQTNAILDFQEYNYDSQRETMPTQFTGSVNADGVAVSVDGVHWQRLLVPTNQYAYVNRTTNLAAFAASRGLALAANFKIKFQQYDRYPLPIYGRCFDNVQVYDPARITDVRLSILESADPVTPGSNLVYVLTVTNAGPLAAAAVVVSNQLPAGANLVSATSSQGACTPEADWVVCDLGELPARGSATATLTVVPADFGVLTNRAWAASATFDPFRTNDWAIATTTVDEQGGTLQLQNNPPVESEDVGTAYVVVLRSDHAYGEITVDFATVDGTALAGEDYRGTNGTLTFASGQTWQVIPIAILNDDLDEPSETFSVALSNPGGEAVLGDRVSQTATIVDDDGRAPFPFHESFESGALSNYWRTYSGNTGRILVTTNNGPPAGNCHVTMDSYQSGSYGLNELVLTVDLSGQQGVTLAFWQREFGDEDQTMSSSFSGHQNVDGVAISANGTNWVKATGLTAAEGSTNGYRHYEVALDPLVVAYGLSYTSTFKIKFQQYDDYPIPTDGFAFDEIDLFARHGDLRFGQAVFAAAESNGTAVVAVERLNGSYGEVAVPFSAADGTATDGADYAATNGILTFADGVSTGSFVVVLADDADDEPDETILLTLGEPAGGAILVAPSNAVLTVRDDDGAGAFAFAADTFTATESNGWATIDVRRLGGAEGEVSVDFAAVAGTAAAGEDFVAVAGTLVFGAGETNRQFAVELLNDAVREDNETVLLELANPAAGAALGEPAAAVLNVVDDEDPNYDYYLPAYGKEGAALRQALHDVVDDHVAFDYDTIWTILQQTDECPTNANQVQLVYVQAGRDKNNNGGNLGQWNREHLWPQSHGFPDALSTAVPPSVDAHNLKPADVAVNSLRGEKDFDEGGTPVDGAPPTCRTTAGTFEPPDAAKGDVARAMFYMDVRYAGDKDGEPDLQLVDAINTSGTQLGKLSTLIRWHFQDPPDDFERRRNDLIFANWQGNRNPFVDHPEWVLKVWTYGFAIATTAGIGGAIAPANPQVPYHSDQAFEIQPEPYWHVADVRTNGVSLGADYGAATFAFTWGTVVTNGTLEAVFAANLAPRGTPEWWLAQLGFTNDFAAAEESDLDADGLFAWQEFRAGTRADDPASALQIERLEPAETGAGLVLRWQSASNRFYSIGLAAGHPGAYGQLVATNLPAKPPVNVYTAAVDGLTNAFFRIELAP